MTRANTIAVHITVKDSDDIERHVLLPSIKRPVEYRVLAEHISKMGYPACSAFTSQTEFELEVTAGQSSFDEGTGGTINLFACYLTVDERDTGNRSNSDQPLITYYNDCYLPVVCPRNETRPEQCSGAEMLPDEKIKIGDLATVGFQRTIRVPDDNKTQALPPDMGPFPVYNMADVVDHLPKEIASKGGVCIPMYQREAMWISFERIQDCAIKISVGGVNALTGLSQNASEPGTQDYLALSRSNFGQVWLDRILTSPGVVRQFVAVPLAKGLTVEGQLMESETQGGLQIDVFPLASTTVSFYPKEKIPVSNLYSNYRTPRQLGLSLGDYFCMKDLRKPHISLRAEEGWGTFNPDPAIERLYLKAVSQLARDFVVFVRTLTGKSMMTKCLVSDTVGDLKARIQDKEGIPPSNQRLMYSRIELVGDQKLDEYNICDGATLYLALRLRGGGTSSVPSNIAVGGTSEVPGNVTVGGIAVGGRISQKVNKDALPPFAYNFKQGSHLRVTIINSAYFTALTGLPTPSSPIETSTYIEHGLPWHELYDEHVPVAKCDESCSTVTKCPSCRDRFAASMEMTAEEHDVGVEAGSINERIGKLRLNSGTRKVASFKDMRHEVSPLNGDGKD